MEAKERSEFEMAGERVHKPAHSGPLASFNVYARITGPCGETMEFWLLVDGSKIEKASFVTDGCASHRAETRQCGWPRGRASKRRQVSSSGTSSTPWAGCPKTPNTAPSWRPTR